LSDQDTQRRLNSEREFHNLRFEQETRLAQGKYYAGIKHGTWAFEREVLRIADNADVLEYGCGSAIQGIEVARRAKSLTGIDISEVAVKKARLEAKEAGLDNTEYIVMDAENMTFKQNSFDLIFGRGIIHHLDLNRAFSSIAEALRPGGTALFWEPLGHNPALTAYRLFTPNARTPDEHPIVRSDIRLAEKYFGDVSLRFCGLTTMATVPFRDSKLGDRFLKVADRIDQTLFRTPARWMAWHARIELRQPRRTGDN
jgi:SAM-dependent methyltransferase